MTSCLSPDAAARPLLTETDGVSETIYARIRGSRPSLPSGIIFDNFAASYEASSGTTAQVSVFSAFSYDATWIGLYGLIWAHYQEDPSSGTSIARGLRNLSDTSGMGIPISLSSWTDVMINFEEGSAIDVSGASGSSTLTPPRRRPQTASRSGRLRVRLELQTSLYWKHATQAATSANSIRALRTASVQLHTDLNGPYRRAHRNRMGALPKPINVVNADPTNGHHGHRGFCA